MKITRKALVAKVVQAMAYDRQTYINRLEEKIGGALGEHYKATLAKLNGQTKWVQHWETEVKRLIEQEFPAMLLHAIRGFKDRRKALEQVIRETREKDKNVRTFAYNTLVRDYKLKSLQKDLPPTAMDDFLKMVEEVADAALPKK